MDDLDLTCSTGIPVERMRYSLTVDAAVLGIHKNMEGFVLRKKSKNKKTMFIPNCVIENYDLGPCHLLIVELKVSVMNSIGVKVKRSTLKTLNMANPVIVLSSYCAFV